MTLFSLFCVATNDERGLGRLSHVIMMLVLLEESF